MGGTLTLARTCRSDPVQPACGFGTVVGWGVVLCTLLGPEGPGRRRLRTVSIGPLDFCRLRSFGFVAGEYRPYFENYTVDASILKMQTKWDGRLYGVWNGLSVSQIIQTPPGDVLGYSCDINFLRADGGCLGIWSRRRTYKSAISLGELIIEL